MNVDEESRACSLSTADDLERGILPPVWSIPREWAGERCFVLCGGWSILEQRDVIPQLKGRFIAVKEGVYLRPDADVLFLGGEQTANIAAPLIPRFTGKYMVVRGKSCPEIHRYAAARETPPYTVKRLTRTKDHSRLCDIKTHVCGYDSGTSAINAAYHFGAKEIVLLGYDMDGNRWFKGLLTHPMMNIPKSHHLAHLKPLQSIATDAKARGIRIVNCSKISKATCFDYQPVETFL